MKKNIIARLTVILLLLATLVTSTSCGVSGKAPELDSVKQRFVRLIEESKEFNNLFFGAGLPVYKRDSLLAQRKGIYVYDQQLGYDVIMENSPFYSSADIREAAEKIFSSSYLASISEGALDGILLDDDSAYLRFYESGGQFYQNSNALDFDISERIYDYSSMRILNAIGSNQVTVLIDTYSLADGSKASVEISFTYENGNWYLDSPTY